ncbi:ABC transporter ATP-binding protein [Amphibacillus sediminis]|uniref:ABC transporter ATP-binding protein n=1 Tax=Amphibacillus sediminis TaxID=360185 RepID=UPI00082B0C63|nr:ATP-binding cassette domain-containing protein [Amphibacillus sediminis]
METIIEAEELVKEYKIKKQQLFNKQAYFQAVDHVSLQVRVGQTVGVVGESGSGKSTLSELIGGLQQPTNGSIKYLGKDISSFTSTEYRHFRQNIQFIFQSPKDSLHPFYTIKENLMEPLGIFKKHQPERILLQEIHDMLDQVYLDESILNKHASEISGGQAQRVAIARALILKPKLIIADECVSALDVSVQAQIIQLLKELQQKHQMSYLFISHDISAVNEVADYVMVMKNGQVLEQGMTEQVLFQPKHDYTKTLISSSYLLEREG